MKNILRTEEIAVFVCSLFAVHLLDLSWTWFLILFLAPDLGMIGYLISPATGAALYNTAHHRGLAAIVFLVGMYFQLPQIQLAGLILFSHCSFDRMLGYGLKFSDSFYNTHLGKIGK